MPSLCAPGSRWVAVLCCALFGCCARPVGPQALPGVVVREVEPLRFRGANSPNPREPGDVDCNSPAHWDGDTLYLFNSSGHPWRLAGPDLFHLEQDYRRVEYNDTAPGGRWIECTWRAKDGTLYGWYHFEPTGVCANRHPEAPNMQLTAPRIGAVRSRDNGATWENLGVILDAPGILNCDTKNYYFAGGNGDFSMMLDREERYAYFFISTYVGGTQEQGVAIARMDWRDRDTPAGKVWKWHDGRWNEPGLLGECTPIFPASVNWHEANADAFWGPSIHWNTHLRQYVVLLNRAVDGHWKQEGVYVSFNPSLERPEQWSSPRKILASPGPDRWYPQVIGTARGETDKLAGQRARLFVRGLSKWELEFRNPGETGVDESPVR